MGSVKDLTVLKPATTDRAGVARFTFSDRYSVFDWGEMPDLIPDKGTAIAMLGSYFLEKLESMGVATHFRGMVHNDNVYSLADLPQASNVQEVELVRVIKPQLKDEVYDYSAYQNAGAGFLIPLEVIYRNSLPAGSSVFKRLQNGSITPQDLGLDSMPQPEQRFDQPLLDVSTKLEITDRYMTWREAQQISAMSDAEITALKELTLKVDNLISDEFARIGLVNEDGKIEVAFDYDRQLMVVDVLGTLDECRFTYGALPVSKEIARIWYRGSDWYKAIEDSKKRDRQHWKEICPVQPEPLPVEFRDAIANVYRACTNEITGREWFAGVPGFNEVMQTISNYLEPK